MDLLVPNIETGAYGPVPRQVWEAADHPSIVFVRNPVQKSAPRPAAPWEKAAQAFMLRNTCEPYYLHVSLLWRQARREHTGGFMPDVMKAGLVLLMLFFRTFQQLAVQKTYEYADALRLEKLRSMAVGLKAKLH